MSDNTVRFIVQTYLVAHGFDGLYNTDAECGCCIDDLEPCFDGMQNECKAGYKAPCDQECGHEGGDGAWHIQPDKPDAQAEKDGG